MPFSPILVRVIICTMNPNHINNPIINIPQIQAWKMDYYLWRLLYFLFTLGVIMCPE